MRLSKFLSVGFTVQVLMILFTTIAGCAVHKTTTLILPEKTNGIYTLKIDNKLLEADPENGGRIISLQLDGKNFFTGSDVNALYWGSSFWPSPQTAWGKSSLAELDTKPYTVSADRNKIKMVSQPSPSFGYTFIKEISANKKNSSFTIRYTIINQAYTVKKVAPWEVTRVHPDGLTFYPKGSSERWGNMANLAEDKNGITWFAYERDKISAANNKFFSDGSGGWIAQVNDDVLFVKKFRDEPIERAAPSEAEVEVYTNKDKSYVEVEVQGPYEELRPGASLTWEVTWFIRKLPAHIKPIPGNTALVNYVRNW